MSPFALLLGACLATGLVLMASSVRSWRSARLPDRVEPYLGLVAQPSRLLTASGESVPWPTAIRLFKPVIDDLVGRVDRLMGGSGSAKRRLDKLGPDHSLEKFRLEQLTWGLIGLGSSVLLLALRIVGGHTPALLPSVVLIVVGGLVGLLLRDRLLTMSVTRRTARMQTEFPTVVELLTLAVGAGEGLTAALERVSRVGNGSFVGELQRCLGDIRSGTSSIDALGRLADRVELPEIRRFVDAVVVALERGTPLADVLNAQTADAREAGRRALIEAGGRKEIAMMVPVVFLVLPLSVLFALFPGFYGLSLGST